jgi:hypothetical protein
MEERTLTINVSGDEPKPKYDEWEVRSAADTLIRAEEIKQNEELMALVAPELEKKSKAYKGIADILYGKEEKKEGK